MDNENIDTKTLIKLLENYKPFAIQVIDYYQYIFTIRFKIIDKEYISDCGGIAENIYNFYPFLGWKEWKKAKILSIKKIN